MIARLALAGLVMLLGCFSCQEIAAQVASQAKPQGSTEPLLARLPAGVFLKSSTVLQGKQCDAIAAKLGGKINRLSNSVVQLQGRPLQVNIIACDTEKDAENVFRSLQKIKPEPFIGKYQKIVVEYVGNGLEEAVAIKANYELGFVAKPESIRYRVQAELGTLKSGDAVACNKLFNLFLMSQAAEAKRDGEVSALLQGLKFGKSLHLQSTPVADDRKVEFTPAAKASELLGSSIRFDFDKPSMRGSVPFVAMSLEASVSSTGRTLREDVDFERLVASTARWPADDKAIKELAEKITDGKKTRQEKVDALLVWLAPGKNIKYAGETGSRWGTKKALDQKFGHCWDFSDLFVTMARSLGIPTRQVAGWLYGSSGHVWCEFMLVDSASGKAVWQQVDPTGGNILSCGIYHIPYFSTDDGELAILYLSMPKIEIVSTK